MLPKTRPTMRQLSVASYALVGAALVLAGWAVWRTASTTLRPVQGESTGRGSDSGLTGSPAADFSVTLFDTGETVTLSGLRGQPVILDFFASWCPSCRVEAPKLQQFWQAYQGKGITLLGVALNDSVDGLRDFREEFGLTYPMGLDKTGEIAPAALPTSP